MRSTRIAISIAAVWSAGLIGTPALPAYAQQPAQSQEQPQRQLGAHTHGQGKLSIAIERRTLEMELEAPGSDIVGFEHEAKTGEQKAAMTKARATLSKPLGLFKLPEAAGCKQTAAKVKLVAGGGHDHAHEKKGAAKPDASATHSEFHAEYTFACSKPELLQAIDVDYFKIFPAAQSLEVSLIGPKGQAKQNITKDAPRIELKAAM